MRALIRWFLQRIPYVGNLVKTKYLVGNPSIGIPMRKQPCRTVILRELYKGTSGLVVSDVELSEANRRFCKYNEQVEAHVSHAFNNPGELVHVKLHPRNWKNTNVEFYVVVLSGWLAPMVRTGFMFSLSELQEIEERTLRLKTAVKRPNCVQRFLIKIYGLEE